jgi:hypothetical protein
MAREARKARTAHAARRRLTGLDLAPCLGAGIAALGLYARTLYPGLLPGDSGEFQVLARLLGNTHPTGYQVYVLFAYPFSWLPVGSIAYRTNLFSAAMGALAIAGTYLAGRLLTGRCWAALLGALALCVAATFWSQALIAEVYTAGAAFLAGVLVSLLYWHRTEHAWALATAALLGGLSLGVHLTVSLVGPAAALYVWLRRRWEWKTWRVTLVGASAGVCIAVGAFVALDARNSPADFIRVAILPSRSVYGLSEANLDSPFERLAFSLGGRQFRQRMFAGGREVMERNVRAFVDNLEHEFSLPTLALAVLGSLAVLTRQRQLAVLLLGSLALQWAYAFNYDIGDIYVFHVPSYLLMALLAAAGAAWLADATARWRSSAWQRRALAGLAATLLTAAAIWPVALPRLPALRAGRVPQFPFEHYPVSDDLAQEHLRLRLVVQRLEPGALLFAEWRRLYPYYYVAHVEEGRSDLRFAELQPHRVGESEETSVIEYVGRQLKERAVYLERCLPELAHAGLICWPVPAGVDTLYRMRQARAP